MIYNQKCLPYIYPPATVLPSPPSQAEAKLYYTGLHSAPVLVARTGTTLWEEPTSPESHWHQELKLKELHPIGNHAIKAVWEDNMAFKLHDLLESMQVKWTSTDVLRIGYVGEHSAPVVLWIGVMPASLSGNDGVSVVSKCQELLGEYNITDVNVEIRESELVSPKLLMPAYTDKPTVVVVD